MRGAKHQRDYLTRKGLRESIKSDVKKSRSKASIYPLSLSIILPTFTIYVLLIFGSWKIVDCFFDRTNENITDVQVEKNLKYLDYNKIQEDILLCRNRFWSVDLEEYRTTLEKNPMIKSVRIRRIWPNKLLIHIEEEIVIARWGSSKLLNFEGVAITPDKSGHYDNLPLLLGPEKSKKKVMRLYATANNILKPTDFFLRSLELSNYGSWNASIWSENSCIDGRIRVFLGEGDVLDKINRFQNIYKTELRNKICNVEGIDLRYVNGLAVKWRKYKKTY